MSLKLTDSFFLHTDNYKPYKDNAQPKTVNSH